MKKWMLLCSAILLILFVAVSMKLEGGTGLEYSIIHEEQAEKIEKDLQISEEDMPFSLCFDGEELPYDTVGQTFFLPLNMQTEDWETGEISATNGYEVFFLSEFTAQSKTKVMQENDSIPFYAVKNGSYGKYNLKITGLPVITFQGTDFTSDSGELLYIFKLYDSGTKTDWVTECYTTSRLRGNTSQTYEKKSLRLNLKKQKKNGTFEKTNKNLLDLRDDDDWILNSLYADNTRIRDKLSMDLWQEVGAAENPYGQNFGTDGEYVEVLINNSYTGLYLLQYPVDQKQLGMEKVSEQIAKGIERPGRIYKKTYTAAWNVQDFEGELPDANMPDYRGGFFLKGDTILGTTAEWEPLHELAACINGEDESFSQKITTIADQDSILRNWLFFQAIAGFDNENKNVYYIAENRDGEYYGYFIPWDLNISFGAVYAENTFYCEESEEAWDVLVAFEPGQRMVLLNVSDSDRYVQSMWEEWRKDTFSSEGLMERVDQLQDTINDSGALAREMERWPMGNADPDCTFMKEFTLKRMEFVDEYLENLAKKE